MTAIHELAKKWAKEVVKLNALPVPPFLQSRKDELIRRAMTIKSLLEKSDHLGKPISELGFLPLLVVGGVAAATAMTKWITDAKKVSDVANQSQTDADAIKKLIATGLTQEQAVSVVLGKKTADWKKWIMPVGLSLFVGGVLWFLMRGRRNAS